MKQKITIITIFLLLIASFLFIPSTNINYDMSIYLPKDSQTKQGLAIIEDEFVTQSTIQVLIMDIAIDDLIAKKALIEDVELVSSTIWLDDYIDLTMVPIEFIPIETRGMFYQDGDALLTIVFDAQNYDPAISDSISQISNILSAYTIHSRGEVLSTIQSREVADGELAKVIFLIVPIILVILFLTAQCWVEPIVILITLGLAILFNLFTNGIFPNVSFMTQTMAIALQLALSIDYALFMIHRFYEEKKTNNPLTAARLARKHSFKPITISALTTIAGFTALFFMEFRIGLDIGLVLSKGIIFSYLSTMIVLPILLVWFNSLIEKTKRKLLTPNFKKLFNFQYKFKYLLLPLLIIIIAFGFYFQQHTTYFFGDSSIASDQATLQIDQNAISERFGANNQIVILFPNESITQEVSLVQSLLAHPKITSVNALVTSVDPLIPRDMLPDTLVGAFVGHTHSRMIITTSLTQENEELFAFVADLSSLVEQQYSSHYLVGTSVATYEIKNSIENQALLIMLLSVIAVGLVIGFAFKSFSIPVILVGLIQGAIWINVAILYISNIQLQYIGFLVVMSIQLGATIDYAVLLTNRYAEFRKSLSKKEAMQQAYSKSSITIIISSTILMVAGFVQGLSSDFSSVAEIGMLLGKGALISALLILIFLPVTLVTLDTVLMIKKRIHTK